MTVQLPRAMGDAIACMRVADDMFLVVQPSTPGLTDAHETFEDDSAVSIDAFDGDWNYLGSLVRTTTETTALALVPVAVDAAFRVFSLNATTYTPEGP